MDRVIGAALLDYPVAEIYHSAALYWERKKPEGDGRRSA